jgi:hypothetical protein
MTVLENLAALKSLYAIVTNSERLVARMQFFFKQLPPIRFVHLLFLPPNLVTAIMNPATSTAPKISPVEMAHIQDSPSAKFSHSQSEFLSLRQIQSQPI